MVYGPLAPRKLPKQDARKAVFIADRWIRAATPQAKWAEGAKECVDFLEGRQWTEAEKAELAAQGRPALKWNVMAPLYRLVVGYQENNRTDTRFLPGNDAIGNQETAEALSLMHKQFSSATQLPYVDSEVFCDGIATGRGYWDTRLDFEENDLGEFKSISKDPFSTYPDPDADSYDVNEWNYFCDSRWISRDEVEFAYGKEAADLVGSLLGSDGFSAFPQTYHYDAPGETGPVKKFGNDEGDGSEYWNTFHDRWYDFLDPARKNIRLVESQYWVRETRPVFIDLETGDRSVIPDHWNRKRVEKCLYHAERLGNPLAVAERPVKRVRWTAMVGDLIVYDDWSPYDKFTLTGYFPYFRRGQTRGMLDDLIDPQKEINKRRSSEIEIVMRTTNTGWIYPDNAMDPIQEENLKKFGAAPGVHIKYKAGSNNKPERVDPAPPPMAMERLEKSAEDYLKKISGINESAMGEYDRVVSGRALEARQRQAVIGFQMYVSNFRRSKELHARGWLRGVQKHYPEERVVRIVGEDGQMMQTVINQRIADPNAPTTLDRLRDITIGKYMVVVDETPMSASFKSGQFTEAKEILEAMAPVADQLLLPGVAAEVVELSSMPSQVKKKMKEALMGGTAMGAGGVPIPGGAAPSPAGGEGSNVVQLPTAAG